MQLKIIFMISNKIWFQNFSNGQDNDADGISDDDDDEKMSNESSPTPSDSSNGKDYSKDSEKPFSCGQANCTKRFANKFLLKKHQFIHTGLRPHICPFCAKRYDFSYEIKS